MSLINIKNLTFCYDGSHENIFENVNIQLNTDWRLGLVGRNGKGKTTLLKLLLGGLEFSGSISADLQFQYFPYNVEDINATVYEVIYQIDPTAEEWKIYRELNLLELDEVDFERPFGRYSNGEQTKILLAILFSKDNAFLLIDEPTNHLDRIGRNVLSEYLSRKSSYIIVSHDKRFLDSCIDHVISINRADIVVQKGNMTSFLEGQSRQDEHESNENKRLINDIKELKEASQRVSNWADKTEKSKFSGSDNKSGLRPDRGFLGAQSARLMKRASAMKGRISKSIEEKSTLLKNVEYSVELALRGVAFHSERLLHVDRLVINYDERSINAPLSFEVMAGERISLVGKNGCGKSSIIKAILGEISNYNGTINYNSRLKISYLSQDTSWLRGNIDTFCINSKIVKSELISMLFKLGVQLGGQDKRLEELSEGQKKKLLIARCLCQKASLFIWDEPLNYVDIITRQQISDMLINSNATIIFVEHDAEFCDYVSTKIIEIN